MVMRMRCDDVQNLIEALAEGDVQPDAGVSAHLDACRRCAASLSLAHRIHRSLEALPAPEPPAAFTASVIRATHSIRWASEQRFDWWFNAVIGVALVLIAGGVWGLMNLTGLAAVTEGAARFVGGSLPVLYDRARPVLLLYGTAAILVTGALGVWWWLERFSQPRRA